MDLLFKRYASPFLLLDGMIETRRFFEFVREFIDISNNDEIYDLWLHRIFDKGFAEFKNEVLSNMEMRQEENQDVETTIKNSFEILNNFTPEKR